MKIVKKIILVLVVEIYTSITAFCQTSFVLKPIYEVNGKVISLNEQYVNFRIIFNDSSGTIISCNAKKEIIFTDSLCTPEGGGTLEYSYKKKFIKFHFNQFCFTSSKKLFFGIYNPPFNKTIKNYFKERGYIVTKSVQYFRYEGVAFPFSLIKFTDKKKDAAE